MANSLLNKWRNQRLDEARPIKCSVELTYRCNERCTHCYLEKFEDDKARTLSLEEWYQVLRELKAGGVLYLDLMGGEPMLHPHFWEIASYAKELGFFLGMITNGLLINEKTTPRLREIGFNMVTLSLYSSTSLIHDKMTAVRGSHQKTLQAIFFLKENAINTSINCLLTKDNIDSFFDLDKWCVENELALSPDPYITPKMNNDQAPTLFRASREQLLEYYRERARRFGTTDMDAHEPDQHTCGAGKLKCAVNPYGDLLTCLDIRESLGQLHKTPFEKLWFDNPIADKWRNIKNKEIKDLTNQENSHCEHCPAASFQEIGDAYSMTAFSKLIGGVKRQVYLESKTKEFLKAGDNKWTNPTNHH